MLCKCASILMTFDYFGWWSENESPLLLFCSFELSREATPMKKHTPEGELESYLRGYSPSVPTLIELIAVVPSTSFCSNWDTFDPPTTSLSFRGRINPGLWTISSRSTAQLRDGPRTLKLAGNSPSTNTALGQKPQSLDRNRSKITIQEIPVYSFLWRPNWA